jgi:hypothetical protein
VADDKLGDSKATMVRSRAANGYEKERDPDLSKAKKAAFKREHRHLICEECKMNPVEIYGGNEKRSA